jgi:hypothetical protein
MLKRTFLVKEESTKLTLNIFIEELSPKFIKLEKDLDGIRTEEKTLFFKENFELATTETNDPARLPEKWQALIPTLEFKTLPDLNKTESERVAGT